MSLSCDSSWVPLSAFFPEGVVLSDSNSPSLKLVVDGKEITALKEVAQAVIYRSYGTDGPDKASKKEVDKWIAFLAKDGDAQRKAAKEGKPLNMGSLKRLNSHLGITTFVCPFGNAPMGPSPIDILLFGFLEPVVRGIVEKKMIPEADRIDVVHLLRWFDYLQHLYARKETSFSIIQVPLQAPAAKKEQAPAKGAGAKGKPKPSAKPAGKPSAKAGVDISKVNIVVGKITNVELHPSADTLYLEKIDVGQEKPLDVVSGLVQHVEASALQDRLVLVVTNLKPRGFPGDKVSHGLVLCSKTEDKVEPVLVPAGATPGERVTAEGFSGEPDKVLVPKKRIFENVIKEMSVDKEGRVCFREKPLQSTKGAVTSTLISDKTTIG